MGRLPDLYCVWRSLLPLIFIVTAAFFTSDSYAAAIQLPRTGQTTCWDPSGNTVSCAGTGQDGDKLIGIAWPVPRFTDNGDGTVIDNLTGLIWLKNANCFGPQPWPNALTNANSLVSGACGLTDGSTAGQWRLPNINEMESLVDEQNAGPSLPSGNNFGNLQATYYWSSSSYANSADHAWGVSLLDGYLSNAPKSSAFLVWAVRGGGVSLPATGQTGCWDAAGNAIICSGTGQDGEKQMGVTWPAPRYTDIGNGTVTDNLTGLVWLKNANCTDTAGGITKTGGNLTWANALTWSNNLASGSCGLSDDSTAGQWRLPNRKELSSLANRQQAGNSTWLNAQGLANVQAAAYWSSDSYANYPSYAWSVRMYDGGAYSDAKGTSYFVWPVRGGQSGPQIPDTGITAYPPASTTLTAAGFVFTSPDQSATFECKLDGDGWGGCTSPLGYTGLAIGNHMFSVRARNSAGYDSTPASYSWTIVNACNAKIGTTCYGTLAEAYAAATGGDTIRLQAITFAEGLVANRGLPVTLQGGYDAAFTEPPAGFSTITGLTVTSDTLIVSGIGM